MVFFSENIPQLLIVMGIVALIIEIAVLGFSTFVLFFVGLAFIITSIFMYIDVLEPNWLTATYSSSIMTFLLAICLWKPLKNMQERQGSTSIKTDFADITFVLVDDIDSNSSYHYAYSGIQWQIKSNTPLTKGTLVKVVKKEVGIFWVKAVE